MVVFVPKKGFKVITVSEKVYNRLNLIALSAGYRGYGAVQRFLKRNVCGFRT